MNQHKTQFWSGAALWCALCGITVPTLALSRMTDVTLLELINQSDVIVFGHISSTATSDSRVASGPVRFEVLSMLKGAHTFGPGKIALLCNPHNNSELPDLSKLNGNTVVFLSTGKDCFALSHGYVSVVQVAGGRASTYAIKDQPQSQSWKSFLHQVRAIVSSH